MFQASSTGKMALIAQQQRMDTVANNLANANTSGFKARSVTFKDMLYTKMYRPVGTQEGNLQKGTGVLVAATDLLMRNGIPEMTGATLDFFLEGDGMFVVQDVEGNTRYTRNGALTISVEGSSCFLVTSEGHYVLDEQGEKIEFPEGANITDVAVDNDGSLRVGKEEPFAKLGLRWFPNPYGLDTVGSTCFAENAASGEPTAAPENTVVRQGYLEASNVDVAMEMVNLIKTQRAFSFASRAITTADEMQALANNMRN